MSKVSVETDRLLQQEDEHSYAPYVRNYGISCNGDEETAATIPDPEEQSGLNKSSKKQGAIIAILLLGISYHLSIKHKSLR